MKSEFLGRFSFLMLLIVVSTTGYSQKNVPLGIHYQAVARDRYGNELVNTKISVKFSIISEDPLSSPVYQELHQAVTTSKFGVFSIVIGRGVPTGNSPCTSLSEIEWGMANHFLKVEVKFENDFMDMGTMQFLAVPYALYAQKSLEPGPQGPKGDQGEKGVPGDPASDDQTLSVVNIEGSDYLAILGGNQVKLSTIDNQTLNLTGDVLTIARGNNVNLSPYKDNTDNQTLNLVGDVLSIASGNYVNLSGFRDNTDNQQLSYSEENNSLTITGGTPVSLGSMMAFRGKKTTSTTALPMSNVDFIADNVEYNDGSGLNTNTGEFTATNTGIYTFDIKYLAAGNGKDVSIYKNGNLYETLASGLSSGSVFYRTITIKLIASDKIKLVIFTGTDQNIGTGTFSGYKVY